MEEDQWYLPKDDTDFFPTVQEGMDYEEELLLREQGVCLMQSIGARLEIPVYALATAAVLFHRFFMRKSFYDYKLQKVAQACLFIACKSEEASRRPQDLAKSWLYEPDVEVSEEEINAFVEDLLHFELVVMEVTCFDFFLEHPYIQLYEFATEIDAPAEAVNAAIAFVNDSFRLPMCLWFDSRAIAAGALICGYISSMFSFPDDEDTFWGSYINYHYDIVGDVLDSITDVYKISKLPFSSDSPNNDNDDD